MSVNVFGGGGGGNNVFGGGGGLTFADAAPTPGKKKEHHGFFHNLISDVGDLAEGLFTAPITIGTIAANDIHHIFTGSGSFKSDDLVKGVWDQFSHTYAPLMHGDFHEFEKRVSEHPLGPILDVLTVVTLGGAGAAKAAQVAGRAGLAGEGALRAVAGLEKVDSLQGLKDAEAVAGRKGLTTPSGEHFAPTIRKLHIAGKGAEDGRVAELASKANPVRRLQATAFDKISEAFPELRVIGAAARVGRADRMTAARAAQHAAATEIGPLEKFMSSKSGKLFRNNPRMQAALESALSKVPSAHRLEQLNEDLNIAQGGSGGRIHETRVAGLERKIEEAQAAGASPADLDLLKGELQALHTGTDKLRANRKVIVPRIVGRIQAHEDLLKQPLTAEEQAAIKQALPHVKRATDAVTEALKAGGRTPREDINLLPQRMSGVATDALNKDAITFPHTSTVKLKGVAGERIQGLRNPKLPDSARFNSGFSYRAGLNNLSLDAVSQAYRQAARYTDARRRWSTLITSAVHLEAGDDLPKGYVELTNPKLMRHIENVQAFVSEDMPRLFGPESPLVGELQHMMVDGLTAKLEGTTGRLAIPKQYYRELTEDLERSHTFIKRFIDRPTAVWRALTLNLRPAWMVNNIVGQTFLLSATHGVFNSIRAAIMLRKHGKLVDEFAPALRYTGVARQETALTEELLNRSFASKLFGRIGHGSAQIVHKMGELNAFLSDDIPRRAAFLAEIRPHVNRIMREKGVDFETAARVYLSDRRNTDRVINKTLNDLIDFSNMSSFERETVRRLVPFYSWIKGSTKRGGQLLVEKPGQARLLGLVGQYGQSQGPFTNGKVPSYLTGAIPIGSTGVGALDSILGITKKGGHQSALVTGGINPFQTPADLLRQVENLATGAEQRDFGPDNPLSQTNPLLKGLLEAAFNRDVFTGQQVGDMPFLERYLKQLALSTPESRTLQTLTRDKSFDNSRTFTPSSAQELRKFLGLPARDVNLPAAQKAADKEGKTPKYIQQDGHIYMDVGESGKKKKKKKTGGLVV